jgi:hypothetical protein
VPFTPGTPAVHGSLSASALPFASSVVSGNCPRFQKGWLKRMSSSVCRRESTEMRSQLGARVSCYPQERRRGDGMGMGFAHLSVHSSVYVCHPAVKGTRRSVHHEYVFSTALSAGFGPQLSAPWT